MTIFNSIIIISNIFLSKTTWNIFPKKLHGEAHLYNHDWWKMTEWGISHDVDWLYIVEIADVLSLVLTDLRERCTRCSWTMRASLCIFDWPSPQNPVCGWHMSSITVFAVQPATDWLVQLNQTLLFAALSLCPSQSWLGLAGSETWGTQYSIRITGQDNKFFN